MAKLALIGVSLLAFHGHHQPRYWWPAMTNCTIVVGQRRGVFVVGNVPYVTCTPSPAHWASKPPPVEQPAG